MARTEVGRLLAESWTVAIGRSGPPEPARPTHAPGSVRPARSSRLARLPRLPRLSRPALTRPLLVPRGRTRGPRRWAVAGVSVTMAAAVMTVGGTWAAWTDSAAVGGTSVSGGTIDVTVDGANSVTTSTLSLPLMVPGSASAQVFTVRNAGTAPMKYAITGALTGSGSSALATSGSLKISVVSGGTRTTGVTGATCTGGTTLVNALSLTDVAGTGILPLRGPLAASASESVCVQLTLDLSAPTTLQGLTAGVGLSVTGTSDLS